MVYIYWNFSPPTHGKNLLSGYPSIYIYSSPLYLMMLDYEPYTIFYARTPCSILDRPLSSWKPLPSVSLTTILNLKETSLYRSLGQLWVPILQLRMPISLWASSNIWHNNLFSSNIMFYGRYMDDVIIIWDGSPSTMQDFVSHCNSNNMGHFFMSVIVKDSLAFLDLELYHVGNKIHAQNYTKPTLGNSFLHYDSCHHPWWLKKQPILPIEKQLYSSLRLSKS